MHKQPGRRAGFTMIELLTVIAIIAILMAILLPVFSAVRRSVRETSCINNLTQISQALTLYHDNWDRYPITLDSFTTGGVTFRSMFPQYLKSEDVLRCPDNQYPATDAGVSPLSGAQLTNAGQAVKQYTWPTAPNGAPTLSVQPVQLCVAGSRWAIRVTCRAGETGVPIQYARRDSYDGGFWPPRSTNNPYLVKYNLDWTEAPANPGDVPRQLKYRTPPADTVVTWCLNHTSPDGATGVPQGNAIVLFLDGRVKKIPGQRFDFNNPADGYNYQVRP